MRNTYTQLTQHWSLYGAFEVNPAVFRFDESPVGDDVGIVFLCEKKMLCQIEHASIAVIVVVIIIVVIIIAVFIINTIFVIKFS